MRISASKIFAGVAAVLISACTGTARYVPSPQAIQDLHRVAGARTSPYKGMVFISDTANGVVWMCPTKDIRRGIEAPVGQLQGTATPVQLATDKFGTIYVANAEIDLTGAGAVTEYERGRTKPSRTLTTGLTIATGIAVDLQGSVYVSNKYAGSIVKFPKAKSVPSATYTKNLIGPDGLAVDAKGNLFIADGSGNDVLELKAGGTVPESLGLKGLHRPIGVAIDSRENLYVSNYVGSESTVNVYARDSTTPVRHFIVYGPEFGRSASIGLPVMLSITADDMLLVATNLSIAYDEIGWGGFTGVIAAYKHGQSQATWAVPTQGYWPNVNVLADDAIFQRGD